MTTPAGAPAAPDLMKRRVPEQRNSSRNPRPARTGWRVLIGLLAVALPASPRLSLPALPSGDPPPEVLIKEGHWKQARSVVGPRYQARPDDPQLNYLMSEIEEAFGDLADARTHAGKAVELQDANSSYHLQLGEVDGETAETVGLFSKLGWAKKFKAEVDRAVTLDPKNLDARFALLEFDLQAPGMIGGGKDKARAMADEIARIDPAQGYLAEARLARDRKDPAAEESWYLKALAAEPADYEVVLAAADFYSRQNPPKFDSAEKYARQAIKIDPGRVAAWSLLASTLALQGRWKDLDAALEAAEQSVPDDLAPYYQAARAILVRSGNAPNPAGAPDLKRADGYLRKYLGAEPEGGEPTLAHAHWRLGEVLEKEGRKADAVSELKAALNLKPDLDEAKRDLNRLQ